MIISTAVLDYNLRPVKLAVCRIYFYEIENAARFPSSTPEKGTVVRSLVLDSLYCIVQPQTVTQNCRYILNTILHFVCLEHKGDMSSVHGAMSTVSQLPLRTNIHSVIPEPVF